MEPDPFAIFIVLFGMMFTILGVYGVSAGEYVYFGRRFRHYVVSGRRGVIMAWASMIVGVFSVVFSVAYIFGYIDLWYSLCGCGPAFLLLQLSAIFFGRS